MAERSILDVQIEATRKILDAKDAALAEIAKAERAAESARNSQADAEAKLMHAKMRITFLERDLEFQKGRASEAEDNWHASRATVLKLEDEMCQKDYKIAELRAKLAVFCAPPGGASLTVSGA